MMKNLTNRLLLFFTLSVCALSWIIWEIVSFGLKMEIFVAFPALVLSVYVLGLLLLFALHKSYKSNQKQLINTFLLSKIVKMIIFVLIALVYIKLVGVNTKMFLAVFGIYYIFFLLFEIYAVFRYEKQIKK